MKSLKVKFIAMFVVLGCVIGSSLAIAGDHSSCTVNKVGVYPSLSDPNLQRSGYPIFLTCSDLGSSQVMFYLSESMGDAGLATALTAMSLGKPVWARTTTDTAGGLLTVLYLAN